MNNRRLHLLISGEVQGVGYRASAYRYASQSGLTGWVRNHADGRVEIVAEGQQQQLTDFADWSTKGPRHANVSEVVIDYQDAINDFQEFTIR